MLTLDHGMRNLLAFQQEVYQSEVKLQFPNDITIRCTLTIFSMDYYLQVLLVLHPKGDQTFKNDYANY